MNSNAPFGFDAPEQSPGFLLWQTTMCWQRLIKKELETYDISHAQFVIMATLLWWHMHNKQITQKEIITMSQLDKMTVSKSLKKLAGAKLIKRKEKKEDTRTKLVVLTKQGIVLIEKLIPLVESLDTQFFGKLSPQEEQQLLPLLQKLI